MPKTRFWMGLLVALLISPLAAQESPSRPALWMDLLSGEPISFASVVDDLASVKVVYLGEIHSLTRHHELQRRIVTALARRGRKIVLGLEQLEKQFQGTLDRYASGEIDFDTLAREVNWTHRWGGYTHYRPVIEAARAAGAHLLALNARNETVRAVARKGLSGLDEKERAELPEFVQLEDPPYERLLHLQLQVHASMKPSQLRSVYEAQVTRDETMAAVLSQFLRTHDDNFTAVVLCGRGHVAYGMGIPSRVRLRLPSVTDRIVLFSESGDLHLTEKQKAQARDVEITHADLQRSQRPLGDYLHIVEEAKGG